MSFKLKNKYEMFGYNKDYSNGDRLVVEKKLPKDVYGQINPNGVIEDIYVNFISDVVSIGASIKVEDEYLKVLNLK